MNTHPWTAESGVLFRRVFLIRDKTTGQILSPTGYTVTFQIKEKPESLTALLTASTVNGKITFDGNQVIINVPANEFSVPARQLPYWAGIKVVSASGVTYSTVVRQLVINPKFIV